VIYAVAVINILTVSSTSALFFFRVKAVFLNNRMITAFFGFLWFTLTGLCFSLPFVVKATHIPTTQICIVSRFAYFGTIPNIAHVIYDTFVFVSISLRIISFSIVGDTFTARTRSFFRGDGVPSFSKSVLYGGQLYYMSVISCPYARHPLMLRPVRP
jgi:hypothetical protein